MRTHTRRLAAALVVACLALLASSGTALAQDAPGDVLIFSGPVTVDRDETLRSLIVFQGPTRIEGRVVGDVVALGGDVDVTGQVGGSVSALSGTIRVEPGARVARDLTSPRPPRIEPGGFVGGAVQPIETRMSTGAQLLGQLATWLVVTSSVFLLALVLGFLVPPAAANAAYEAARRSPLRSLGVGFLSAIGMPAAAVLAMLTIVGIPLGLALLSAIALFSAVGYVTAGWLLGRRLAEGSARMETWPRAAWLVVGLGLLRVVALVPILHVVAWILASSFGFGALALALWRVRFRPSAPPTISVGPPSGTPIPAE